MSRSVFALAYLVAAVMALAFLALLAVSWGAEAGGRLATLLDRLATPLRIVIVALFALAAWAAARRSLYT